MIRRSFDVRHLCVTLAVAAVWVTSAHAEPNVPFPMRGSDAVGSPCDALPMDPFAVGLCAPNDCRRGWRDGWHIGGWVDVGTTINARRPRNPAAGFGNLPLTFNYRDRELQLQQLYLIASRDADGSRGWDLGGRVDLLYGEDYLFLTAVGLEEDDRGNQHWANDQGGNSGGINGSSRLNLALPQAYGEIAYGDARVKLGHFYSILGYESAMAPENFFYSRSYMRQYAEPFTHTGALASWGRGDWRLSAGVVNGSNKFDSESDHASFLGGFAWNDRNNDSSLAFSIITGHEDGTDLPLLAQAGLLVPGTQTIYSLIYQRQLLEDVRYVLQHDLGVRQRGTAAGDTAEWYGLSQYLFWTVSNQWQAGMRYEWFNDQNGTRVTTSGGHWHEAALGLNWSPLAHLVLRPETRWDWFDPHGNAPPGPFDNFTQRSQFTVALDVIATF